MSHSNSKKAVVVALAGNIIITISKFIASYFTRSASMLAESIHSSADCLNQVFLLIGGKRTKKQVDEKHPFGYGREEFFWGFMVAILLFFGGALFSFYEGVHKIMHPEPIQHFWWGFGVLGFSLLIEIKSFTVAYGELKKTHPNGFIKAIKDSIDTNLIVIVLEDLAALLGLAIAFVCTILALYNPIFDGIGSIGVGLVLTFIAYSLSNELRQLIVGENMNRVDRSKIKSIVKNFDIVSEINTIKATTIGNNKYLLVISINVNDLTTGFVIENAIDAMKKEIIKEFHQVSEMYIEVSN